jgi:hypothetical protein
MLTWLGNDFVSDPRSGFRSGRSAVSVGTTFLAWGAKIGYYQPWLVFPDTSSVWCL